MHMKKKTSSIKVRGRKLTDEQLVELITSRMTKGGAFMDWPEGTSYLQNREKVKAEVTVNRQTMTDEEFKACYVNYIW